MYSFIRLNHESYGDIIQIRRVDDGNYQCPFELIRNVLMEKRLWSEQDTLSRIRLLVDNQILSAKQLEHWAIQEYKSLPKCSNCASLLQDKIYNHHLSNDFFCSQECANKSYSKYLESEDLEEEIEYL